MTKLRNYSAPNVLGIVSILVVNGCGGSSLDDVSIDQGLASTEAAATYEPRFGLISGDTGWSGNIRITGDVYVEPGVTLEILPGTHILVAANSDVQNLFGADSCGGTGFDLRTGILSGSPFCGVNTGEPLRDEGNHVSIVVDGTLLAIGEPGNRITIESDAATPSRWDWNRLSIRAGVLGFANVSDYRVIDTYPPYGEVTFHNNVLKHVGECAICANSSGTRVVDNHISDAHHELVDIHQASPVILGNTFDNPTKAGVTVASGHPVIEGNHFVSSGIFFTDQHGPGGGHITHNTLESSAGMALKCSSPVITHNNIYGPVRIDGSAAGDNGNKCAPSIPGTLDATNNYWNTTQPGVINSRITDQADQAGRRQLIFQPFLKKKVSGAP